MSIPRKLMEMTFSQSDHLRTAVQDSRWKLTFAQCVTTVMSTERQPDKWDTKPKYTSQDARKPPSANKMHQLRKWLPKDWHSCSH